MDLFGMADELRHRAGKDAPMSLPDMQTPPDVAAQIRDKSDLFMAMIDEPEVVLELTENIFERDTLNELSCRYGGIGIHSRSDSEHQWKNLAR